MSKDYPCVYWNDGKCKKFSDDKVTSWCVWGPCDSQTPSNADRIRTMSDMELAIHLNIGWECSTCKEQIWIDNKFSLGDCDMNCVGHCLKWLKKPSEVSE